MAKLSNMDAYNQILQWKPAVKKANTVVNIPSTKAPTSYSLPTITTPKVDPTPIKMPTLKDIGNVLKTPFNIASRGQDVLIKSLDDLSGASRVNATGRGDGKPTGYMTDTGSAVGNFLGDTIGTGAMFALNPEGGAVGANIQKGLSPIGNLAEKAATKGLTKIAPKLPSAVNKVANYTLPTIARNASEGAALGAGEGIAEGKNPNEVATDVLNTAGQFAAFGIGAKSIGSAFTHTLGKLGKVKVNADDGFNVTYTKEDGSTGSMRKVIFDKEAQPLTVQEGVNTLNQSRLTDIPMYKADSTKVANELPTINKVEQPIEQPKTEVIPHNINDEVLFNDSLNRINAGTINKINTNGTVEIKTPEGDLYNATRNGEEYNINLSKPTAKEQIPIDDRISVNKEVLKDKTVLPYQQLHPELKSHIQQEADVMIGELQRSVKGGRTTTKLDTGHMETKTTGLKRMTSSEVASLLNEGYKYKDIENALKRIVKDHGQENTMLAKRIEALIDMRLTKGYSEFDSPIEVKPNQEYINIKDNIEGNTPKTNIEPITATLPESQAITPQAMNNATSEPVQATQGSMNANNGINLQTFAGEGEKPPTPDSIEVPFKFEINNRKADKATSEFYSNSLKETQILPGEVKSMLDEHKYLYDKETNAGQLEEAQRTIKNNGINEEIKRLQDSKAMLEGSDTMEHLLITKELLVEAQKTGDYSKLKRFTEYTQDKITQTAKGLQAVSAFKRMTPEGMLMTATKELKKAVDELPKNTVKKAKKEVEEATKKATEEGKLPKEIDDIVSKIYKKHDIPNLSNDDTKFIIDTMEKAQKLEGREKEVEIAKAVQFIADKIPATLSEKIRGLQRIAMLLNPKTMIRNVGGNVIMGVAENIKDFPATALDMMLSKKSGARTTGLPNPKTQGQEIVQGYKNVRQDAKLGIDTSPSRGQYELPQGRIFKSKTLNKLDSMTKHGLHMGDVPFYRAAYMDSLKKQMKANGATETTEDMIKVAKETAENRTFQNASAIAHGFDNLRKLLNGETAGGKGKFGFGNLLLPFTKTPANIIDKAIDYSPVAALKLMKQAVEIKKDGLDAFNQKKFVDTFGRGVTGTGMIALGYKLAESGLLTGGEDKDYDKAAIDKLSGTTPYSFKVGDGYYTFDWMQPSSVPLAIGADIFRNGGTTADLKDTLLNAVTSGGNTIFDQSLFQSVKKFMGGYGTVPAFGNVLRDAPQQFMPTVGKQIAQVLDPTARSSYDPSGTATSINKVKAKIPGISSSLQPSVNVLGQETKTYGTSEGIARLANIFLNPGFYTEKSNNPGVELVKKIYDQTGEKIQFPRVADKSFTANGQKITLTAKEYTDYQKLLGQKTDSYLQTLSDSGDYSKMATDIQKKITEINKEAKNQVLSGRNLPMLKTSKTSTTKTPSWIN